MKTARLPQISQIRSAPLAIFMATQAEMKFLATVLQPTGPSAFRSDSMIRVKIEGRELLLAKTGVGPDRAESTARHLFQQIPVAAALSLGVSGGLGPQVQSGDLIVGDQVIRRRSARQVVRGEEGSRSESFPCDAGLQEAALTVIRRLGDRHGIGSILTVDRIVRTVEEKQILAAESGAMALDMESAAIAAAASACSVPFLAIRGILDPVHEDFTIGFDQFLDAEGEPHLPRLMRYLITHPFILPRLVGLGFRTKALCARLGRLLQELSPTLS